MVQTGAQIDTTIEIVTPENIAFRYRLAGPFRRLPAYLIDLAIRFVVAIAALIVLSLTIGTVGFRGLAIGLLLITWFVLAFFYGGLFETFWNGQTPGKRLMRIRVLTVDGQPINGFQAVLRNILRMVDMMPFFMVIDYLTLSCYVVGLLATTISSRFQRIGDLVCGTMVVLDETAWLRGVVRMTEPEVAKMAALVPASFSPSRTLARALAAYVQRRRNFSWGRRIEISRHLAEPLRQKFGLPASTNPDLLLCALYHRVFVTDSYQPADVGGSPFRAAAAARWPHGPAAEAVQR